MNVAWLRCEARPGIFSDESTVVVATIDGRKKTYVVPKDEVSEDRVRVEVEERDGVKWAKLPTDHPYHAIPVPAGDLSEEPVPA